jgi:hypothetical protein
MFWRSSAVIPAHTPGAPGASRATDLCISLVAHFTSYFAGSAHTIISGASSPGRNPSAPVLYGLHVLAPAHLATGLVRLFLVCLFLTSSLGRGSLHPAEHGCQTGKKDVTFGSDGAIETLPACSTLLRQESWTEKGSGTLAAVPPPTPH